MQTIKTLNRALIEPLRDTTTTPTSFNATLDVHGLYSTTQFVLRLSPRIHELVSAQTSGKTEGYSGADLAQAYSTYIHETVHWWQHVGSTTGLILSLSYPTQCYGNIEYLHDVLKEIGPKKPLKRWAENALRGGTSPDDPGLIAANIAVNNANDIELYKRFMIVPSAAVEMYRDPYFENVAHCYSIAYGNTINAIVGSCDIADGYLPDPASWEVHFDRLREEQHEGFYHGSPIRRARVGLHDIFEGQARFIQIQFLYSAGASEQCSDYAADGYFSGIYVSAFTEFLRLTESEWPLLVTNPLIGLFLLICDLAINPTRGFPIDIKNFEDLIIDIDPGARFTLLCEVVVRRPELKVAIQTFSAEEYWSVASELTQICGYDDPRAALQIIATISTGDVGAKAIMLERDSFQFNPTNLPVRVMMSHFFAYSHSKLAHPEFFCWAGIWCAGKDINPIYQAIFREHLSLFSDSGDTQQIFPRNFAGKSPHALKTTTDVFFGTLILYDLTVQWILRDGPFRYDYRWLTGKSENTALVAWAKRNFHHNYGIDPDDFEVHGTT